ncbi:MAG TPA: TIGR04255 family protein [Armatimonadota bacterium]|nr:TIGR04255 family protein [Armatimonadota bacterium]
MPVAYHDNLPNKPLVEAILEIKWGEQTQPDPAYPIIVGRLYEKVREAYPVIEDLPVVQVPPNMTIHVVRHRFRASEDGWPLIQVGPGVVTLNTTESYQWPGFRDRALALHPHIKESHTKPEALNVTSLVLRYIDAVEVDSEQMDMRDFLKRKLHIDVSAPDILFEGQPVENRLTDAIVQLSFPTTSPSGQVQLAISTGQKGGKPAVVWNTLLLSAGTDAQKGWEDFAGWLDAAHSVLHHWFFALIQGDLYEGFARA